MLTEAEALVMSALIEAPIAYAIVRLAGWPGRGAIHAAIASAVATAVTHPQFWAAAVWASPRFGYWPSVMAGEAIVVLAEGFLIAWMAGLTLQRAMTVSLIANFTSCVAGIALIFA